MKLDMKCYALHHVSYSWCCRGVWGCTGGCGVVVVVVTGEGGVVDLDCMLGQRQSSPDHAGESVQLGVVSSDGYLGRERRRERGCGEQ